MINYLQNIKLDSNFSSRVCLFFSFFAIILGSQEAFAGNNDAISIVLCNVVGQLQGGIGKGIATIAIIVLGIGMFLGKLSWPVAIATALGIGLIFGAAGLVGWISSGTGGNTSVSGSTGTGCSTAG